MILRGLLTTGAAGPPARAVARPSRGHARGGARPASPVALRQRRRPRAQQSGRVDGSVAQDTGGPHPRAPRARGGNVARPRGGGGEREGGARRKGRAGAAGRAADGAALWGGDGGMSEKRMQPHGGCEPAVRVTVRTRMMLREAASGDEEYGQYLLLLLRGGQESAGSGICLCVSSLRVVRKFVVAACARTLSRSDHVAPRLASQER